MVSRSLRGALVATAVASLIGSVAATTARAGDAPKVVKCAGVNECKGHGSCKSASNACKGQNGCKGEGWVPTASEKECKAKGGKVIEG